MSIANEIRSSIQQILLDKWDLRDGRMVPATDSVALRGGGVRLDATFLYVDLRHSTQLVENFSSRVAGKVIRSFTHAMCRMINFHQGYVRSFDGDRVMGIFSGDSQNTLAAQCALRMNWCMQEVIKPKLQSQFNGFGPGGFELRHAVGIDSSSVLAIRAGQRRDNDLVWIGAAPNYAAKLSEIDSQSYNSFISEAAWLKVDSEAKISEGQNMWERQWVQGNGLSMNAYASKWRWAA